MGNVLYRKYRSKSLAEIVGQPHITTTLKNAISSNRIAHAYLLTGPRGVGKTSVARIIAREVNGLTYDEAQNHLDIIEIDAASNRRIDEIRELREKVHNAPAQAKYKVYIIDEVHMLTKEAFNALLKTLEEPPAHAIFILATTESHKLPETIISRTQRFTFKAIDVPAIAAHLKDISAQEGIAISDDALELIAKHSRGSFRDSLGLLDQARHVQSAGEKISSDDIATIIGAPSDVVIEEVIQAIKSTDVSAIIASLQTLLEQGVDASYIASDISERIRQQIISTGRVTTRDTRLLKEMTAISSSPDAFLSLEIALLDYVSSDERPALSPTQSDSVLSAQSPPKAATKKNAKPAPEPPKISNSEELPTDEQASADVPQSSMAGQADAAVVASGSLSDAGDIWKEVLNSLKGAHNTLYGMARMAKPSITNDTFQLECKYAFHVKRLSDTYHHKILQDAIMAHSDKPLQLSCILGEKKPVTKAEPDRPEVAAPQESQVETVSNIFGGAEVLES